jgi:putative MATE family efflux protein
MFMRCLLPSLFAAVGLSLGNIADAVMVGSSMGEAGLAALSVASPIYLVFNIIDVGMGIGASVKYDRLLGEGRVSAAVDHFNLMLWITLSVSFAIASGGFFFLPEILSALGAARNADATYRACAAYAGILLEFTPLFFLNIYLYYMVRSDDAQNVAACGLLTGTVIDIATSYVFIFVMDMGITGAAWSVVIGHAVSVVVYSAHIIMRNGILRFGFPRLDLREAGRSFKVGIASSLQYAYQGLFWIAVNNMLPGAFGDTGVAVYGAAINVSYVAMAVSDGLNGALQPLASVFTGERNFSAAARVRELALRGSVVLGLPLFAAIFCFAGKICGVFGLSDPKSLRIGTEALRFYCAGAAFAGCSSVTACFFQAAGAEFFSSVINLFRNILIPLPVCLVLAKYFPEHLWMMFPLTEIACVMIWRSAGCMRRWAAMKANTCDPSRTYSRTITNAAEDIGALVSEVADFCDKWGGDAQKKFHTMIAAEEIATIIIDHATASARGRNMHINISIIAADDGDFYMHVRDNADFFNPLAMDVRKIRSENEDCENLNGLGVLIIKSVAKSMFYRRYRGFNTLVAHI